MIKNKSLLVIGHVWPEPDSSAAGARMMQLLHFFRGEGYKIRFGSATTRTPRSVDLEALGVEIAEIRLNHSGFDEMLRDFRPGIVLFDRFMTEEQFGWRVSETCPEAVRILDTEDLHFFRKARHEALKQGESMSPAFLFSDMAKREIASIYRCDFSLIISEVEMELLKSSFKVPGELLLYLPFMIEYSPDATESLPLFEERKNFISIGNFRHEPNWNAVLQLKQKIWPLIRKNLPEAELHVYGAYPGPKVKQLHNEKEGFLVKGWAPSANQVLKEARVLLAPLQFGAGLKGKFIDGMKAGTPNVTTSIGAEAMGANLPWNGAIRDNEKGFALAAVELYRNKESWQTARQNGYIILQRIFSAAKHRESLREKIDFTANNIVSHRNSNFTGMMLSHHFLSSTRYLSKYIEAKNKMAEKAGSPTEGRSNPNK